MARLKKPHGCFYKAVNVLFSWDNTVYLANDLREIIKTISYSYDGHYEGDDGERYGDKYEYQTANCSPFACPVNKPKWHDEYNWTILSGDGINDHDR